MDLCLYAKNHGIAAEEVAVVTGLIPEQVTSVYKDIDRKRESTRYLHLKPQLVAPVKEIENGFRTKIVSRSDRARR